MTLTATEEKILQAAHEEFVSHGLRGARMQEIADRAEINKALLHYYFRSKEQLYQTVLVNAAGTIAETMASVAAENEANTLQEAVHQLVKTYMGLLTREPRFAGLMMRELADGGENLDVLVGRLEPVLGKMSAQLGFRLVQAQTNAGIQNPMPYPHLMLNIMCMVWGTFLLKPLYLRIFRSIRQNLAEQDDFLEQRTHWITQMVLNTLYVPSPSDNTRHI